MTNYELINRMKELLNEPNFYGSGGNQWSTWQNGKGWYVDCTCSIKAILWGGRFIPENRGKAHAGCNYGSNGVPDFTPASCVTWTNATKGNFNTLVPGEILLMTSHGHAGIYIGNGEVIEVTPAWTGGTPGCQVSKIGTNGERIKNGKQVYSWEYHGKIPTVTYVNPTPKPEPKDPFPGVSDEELAKRVWTGEFGNGDERKARLGIRYAAVQALVNKGIGRDNPPAPSTGFKVGDKVIISGYGNGSSYGDSVRAGGIGWQREILKIYPGRRFPYQVGNSTGTTGFYEASALKKI